MAPFRILSIDGGGIRGIIPAMVLAGTSTGGILALGLVRPGPDGGPIYTAADMVGLYDEGGETIFSRSLGHRVRALGSLLEEKYPSAGIDGVLATHFGDTMLSAAVTPVLLTSYDIEVREPYFFKSHRARTDPRRDHRMRDAARATSAAPTYFEPARLECDTPRQFQALVDGGMVANNPAACALIEGLCEFAADVDEAVMLSLGTGAFTRPIPLDTARGWGLAEWAQPILDVVFDGASDSVDYQVQSLLTRGGDGRYLRLQATLDRETDSMDNARPQNLHLLKVLATRMIHEHDRELDALAARLIAEPGSVRAEAVVRPTPGLAAPSAPSDTTDAPLH